MNNRTQFRLDEVNWRKVGRQLLSNLAYIIMTAFIFVMLFQIYARKNMSVEFSTEATLAVTVQTSSQTSLLDSLGTANSIAQVYAETFQDQIMKDKVIESIGYWPSNTQIYASTISGTNLIKLRVVSGSPKNAYTASNAVLDTYHTVTDYIFDNASVEIIKNSSLSTNSNRILNMGIYSTLAGLIGAVLMTAIFFISTVTEPTISSVNTAHRKLRSKCLGVIVHAKKNKNIKGLNLNGPIMNFDFEEANNQLASLVDHNMTKSGFKTMLVTSIDENEGKSTVAINLAISLRRRNKKVLIVDLDLNKPAIEKMLNYQFESDNTLNSYFRGESSIDDILLKDTSSGLYAILNEKGITDGQDYLTSGRLAVLIAELKTRFDYIILDTAPLIAGTNTEEILPMTDTSLLVIRQDCMDIVSLNEGIESMVDGNSDFMGYVLNDFDKAVIKSSKTQRY